MLPRDMIQQVRRLQLRAKRAVADLLSGDQRSIFQGSGLAFAEVREYQPGDDVRAIDWNVTARAGKPYIKRFVEERELTIVVLLDVSGSQAFGSRLQLKREVAAEITAILAFAALAGDDRVGLALFSAGVDKYLPPRRGDRHALRLLREALAFTPPQRGTNLRAALDYVGRLLHRRAVVVLISDFQDHGYERSFKRMARKHDLIAVRLADPREEELPAVGLLQLEDAETGAQVLLDTFSPDVRRAFSDRAQQRREQLRHLTSATGVDLVEVTTDGAYLEALLRFFRLRQRRYRT